MEIVILLVIAFFIYSFYQNWAKEQPQKAMERIEEYVYQREEKFKKELNKILKEVKEHSEMTIKVHGKKEYIERINNIQNIGIKQKMLSGLNTHLQEKYKFDLKKRAEAWQDYVEWLNAKLSIFSNNESMEYYDDWESIVDENRENEIKSQTIESRLMSNSDKNILKKLGFLSRKKIKL